MAASTVPADTRLPTDTFRLVISPLAAAVMVCRSRGDRVPPAAQAYVPTRAVALVVSVRAPGLARRIFTCRTRAPPFPTWSAGATDSTVPVRVSRVPDRVT